MTNTTVTRNTLVKALYRKVRLSRNECAELLEETLRTITDRLAEGTTVKIVNFGRFSVRHTKTHMGRNPNTGEELRISARRVVVFKPAQKLKHWVNHSEVPLPDMGLNYWLIDEMSAHNEVDGPYPTASMCQNGGCHKPRGSRSRP